MEARWLLCEHKSTILEPCACLVDETLLPHYYVFLLTDPQAAVESHLRSYNSNFLENLKILYIK